MSSPRVQSAARRKKKREAALCFRSSGETTSDYGLRNDVGKETKENQGEEEELARAASKSKTLANQFPFSHTDNFLWTSSFITSLRPSTDAMRR